MNKFWIIVQREYWTRVRKRTFILTTILAPLAIFGFIIMVSLIMNVEGGEDISVAVLDEGETLMESRFQDGKGVFFEYPNKSLEELRVETKEGKYQGILHIPPVKKIQAKRHTINYYREKSIGLDKRGMIQEQVRSKIRSYKIKQLGLDETALESLSTKVDFQPEPLDVDGEKEDSQAAAISAGIGGFMAFIMYMVIFIYGTMVMRSVSEEKVSRIVEVMISSVKPVQLMLGKIVGVGAVGLTQALIWSILLPAVGFIANLIVKPPEAPEMNMSSGGMDMQDLEFTFSQAWEIIVNQNWWLILPLFFFFFIMGYFLYASMFAAVGSAVGEDASDSQALVLPITIPILIAFYIVFVAVRSPDAGLVVFASIFPLFSPIVMPARLAMDPPVWQIILSIVCLIGGTAFFVWLSARIYRVGILMYGKKVSFKELGKWLFYKA